MFRVREEFVNVCVYVGVCRIRDRFSSRRWCRHRPLLSATQNFTSLVPNSLTMLHDHIQYCYLYSHRCPLSTLTNNHTLLSFAVLLKTDKFSCQLHRLVGESHIKMAPCTCSWLALRFDVITLTVAGPPFKRATSKSCRCAAFWLRGEGVQLYLIRCIQKS